MINQDSKEMAPLKLSPTTLWRKSLQGFVLLSTFVIGGSPSLYGITINDVRVSVTADSSAAAREQAIEKAHAQAYQALMQESFPDIVVDTPSQEQLLNMVEVFSIDREKTTPKSYTGSFTFQFNDALLQDWLQQGQQLTNLLDNLESPFANTPFAGQTLKARATYDSLSQWQKIRSLLPQLSEVQNVQVLSVSPQEAIINLAYKGDPDTLRQQMLQKGVLLSPYENHWVISLSTF